MMHQGLDLSRFKKIASDKKTSVLRHAKGHEIKIAHDGLSPAMKDHLDKMPVHLAEGGDPEDTVTEGGEPEETEGAAAPEAPEEDDSEEETPAEEESAPPAAVDQAPEAPEEEEAPAENTPPSAAKKAAVDDNTIVVQGHKRPPTAQELDQDDAHFQDDMMRGHIKPETIQSLYAKQDTLGKIGTLFGLLVSGAGSGLTGQPNAVLEMMKQQVANDLDAQKNSNSNAQNWFQLSLKHEMQKASMKQMAAQNELTKAQTGAVPSEVAMREAQTGKADQESYGVALKNAEHKMMLGVKQHLLGITDKLPDGPTKQRAQDVYQNTVSPAIDQTIKQGNQLLSGQLQLNHAIKQQAAAKTAPEGGGPQLVDTNKIQDLEYNGSKQGALGVTGLMGSKSMMTPQQASQARDEAAQVNKNRMIYDNVSKAFTTLDKQAAGGKVNPGNYQTVVDHLVGQFIQSGIPKDQAEHLAKSSLPGPTDWGATRATKAQQMHDQFQIAEQKTGNLKPFGLLPPFPPPPTLSKEGEVKKAVKGAGGVMDSIMSAIYGSGDKATAAPSAPKDGMKQMSKSGKPMIFQNGAWKYEK